MTNLLPDCRDDQVLPEEHLSRLPPVLAGNRPPRPRLQRNQDRTVPRFRPRRLRDPDPVGNVGAELYGDGHSDDPLPGHQLIDGVQNVCGNQKVKIHQ